jgi:DNA polymerase I-like protein with 3'-5' exonuclease and polymerase domains
MAESLNDGKDLHTAFAASMLGCTYSDMLAKVKAGDKAAKAYRQAAKPCNFGFPGGMGVATFVLTNRKAGIRFCKILEGASECGTHNVTEWRGKSTVPLCARCLDLAEDLKSGWFKQWPEMRQYFSRISHAVDTQGALRQFVSNRIRGGLDFCNGANTLFQGLAADGAKHALTRVSSDCYTDTSSPLWGTRPVVFVHDEIFAETPIQGASKAAKKLAEIMISCMEEYVPDVAIDAKPALMRRWLKNAEPCYDVLGDLVPWEG